MKKSTVIAALAAIVIGACTSVQAAAGPVTVNTTPATCAINSLDIACAFALKPPSTYHGYMDCDMLVSNAWVWMYMEMDMVKDANGVLAITSLTINNVQIPMPEPVYGIPMGDGGVARDVYLYISAMTKTGDYSGWGELRTNVVSKGDSLLVTLMPASITQILPVDVTGYNMVQVVIENFPYGCGWWIEDGQLHVSFAPVGGEYHCVVYDMSGNVIWDGMVEPFKPAISSDDSYVGVALMGNVVGAEFTQPDGQDGWTYISNIKMDCSIPTDDGGVLTGKVVYVDCGTGGLEMRIGGSYSVYVYSATTGMPSLDLRDNSHGNQYPSQTWVNTTAINIGKVVVAIIPKTNNSFGKTYLELHKFYVLPSGIGQ